MPNRIEIDILPSTDGTGFQSQIFFTPECNVVMAIGALEVAKERLLQGLREIKDNAGFAVAAIEVRDLKGSVPREAVTKFSC